MAAEKAEVGGAVKAIIHDTISSRPSLNKLRFGDGETCVGLMDFGHSLTKWALL